MYGHGRYGWLFFSLGTWVAIFLAFILIQTAWCCALNRCGIIAAGVLALVGASIFLAIAIVILDVFNDCGNTYYDDDWGYYDCDAAASWMILSFVNALLWAITGILVLVFACGKGYQDIENQLRAEGAAANQVARATAVAEHPIAVKAVPIAATTPMQQAAGTSTTTITNRPDGSVEKKTVVTNPDGSKTVTVVI
jgi:hypothetical protein